MSEIKVNSIVDASGGSTVQVNGFTPTVSNMAGRNRIINGDMRIDQRNAGAAVSPVNNYTLDRWRGDASVSAGSKYTLQQNAGSVTPPSGFTNYLGCTSSSAYTVGASEIFGIRQSIEGLNIADLAWGTASASTVTLSFWVYSSLTGTFGGALKNNGGTRNYPFQYTISSADTWEQKSVTIAGDTSGTWLTTNGIGIQLFFSIGAGSTVSGTAGSWSSTNYTSATDATSVVGTSGATFYITGVQLEAGSVATPFEHRHYGQELALCQRYYYKVGVETAASVFGSGVYGSTTAAYIVTPFKVEMRSNPTALEQSGTASDYLVRSTSTPACTAAPSFYYANKHMAETVFTTGTATDGSGAVGRSNSTSAYLAWSAEL